MERFPGSRAGRTFQNPDAEGRATRGAPRGDSSEEQVPATRECEAAAQDHGGPAPGRGGQAAGTERPARSRRPACPCEQRARRPPTVSGEGTPRSPGLALQSSRVSCPPQVEPPAP